MSKLCNLLFSNLQYYRNIVKLNDNIIYYLIADVLDLKKTSQKVLLASLYKTDKIFALKLYENSNTITSKT